MTHHVRCQDIEIIWGSSVSIENSVHEGANRADEPLDAICDDRVKDIEAQMEDGEIRERRVRPHLTFVLKDWAGTGRTAWRAILRRARASSS